MVRDDEGFIKARIAADRCVGCGRCERTCPVISPDSSNGDPECRAMAATDEERRPSSSGGVFPLLAKQVLVDGGIVFGAAWNDDFSVSIRGVEDEEGLDALRGSKYVQASTEGTFKEVADAISDGRRVLYSGCPCQIAGLRASLGSTYDSPLLLTAEVICHGAPSAKVLQDYLAEEYGEGNVKSLAFRDKETLGWTAGEKVTLKDGEVVIRHDSPFLAAFNPCLLMNRACGTCPFCRLHRQADVTLGDFWGISMFRPELSDLGGLSAVLVNSERGRKAIAALPEESLITNEVVPVDYASEVNKTIIHPFENNPGRKHFYLSYGMKPFRELTEASLMHHYDVGVVGLWYGINYGSVLTYYALYEVIRKLGYDPVMLPKPNGMWGERFNSPDTLAQRFVNDRCNVFQPYPSLGEYPFANDNCDTFVVGSDVVWSYEVCGGEAGQFFFLDWVRRDRRKVAYAASIGDGLGTNARYVADGTANLSLFDAVSAREGDGAAKLREATGREDVTQVLDPVFLYGADAFSQIADEATGRQAEPGSLFAYVLQGEICTQKRRWVDLVAEHLGTGKFVVGNASDHTAARAIIGKDAVLDIPVEDWIRSVRDSSFYFGDSYHGLCFALMFHVPFLVAYPDFAPAKSRMTSLLGLLGLEDRIVADPQASDEEILAIVDREIDWDAVDETLARAAQESLSWLGDALKTELPGRSDIDLLHDEMLERACRDAMEDRQARDRLAHEIAELRQSGPAERDRLAADLEAVRSSKSFAVGRAVTWAPRKAVSFVRDRMGGR